MNTSTATTAPASAPRTRPAGRRWSRRSSTSGGDSRGPSGMGGARRASRTSPRTVGGSLPRLLDLDVDAQRLLALLVRVGDDDRVGEVDPGLGHLQLAACLLPPLCQLLPPLLRLTLLGDELRVLEGPPG